MHRAIAQHLFRPHADDAAVAGENKSKSFCASHEIPVLQGGRADATAGQESAKLSRCREHGAGQPQGNRFFTQET